ncbi:hypothetical protein YC2023_064491 [Brassica napus]
MEELEKHLKEEIRLREKAEKRLKFLIKKLEFIKGSNSSESSEQSSSSEASCLSSVSTSASNEEEVEEQERNSWKWIFGGRKIVSSGEVSVIASASSQEGESQAGNDFSKGSDTS